MRSAIYIIIAILVAVIDFTIAYLSLTKDKKRSKYLGIALLGTGTAQVCYLVGTLADNYFVMKMAYAFFFSAFPFLLMFMLYHIMVYTNPARTKGSRIWISALWLVTCLDIIQELLNPFNEFVISFVPVHNSKKVANWGFVQHLPYKLHLFFCYFLIFIAFYFIVRKICISPYVYRKKYFTIIIGLSLAVLINAVCIVLQNQGFPDYSQISYCIMGIILYWDVYYNSQKGMMDSVRKVILQELGHPVIMFGEEEVIVACNQSAVQKFFSGGCVEKLTITDFIKKWNLLPLMKDHSESSTFQWNYESKNYQTTYRVDYRTVKDQHSLTIGQFFVFTDTSLEVDLLTGFKSRTAFERYYQNEENADMYPATVAICDINRLGQINHDHGETIGDRCICILAEKMKEYFPSNSLFARLHDANLLVISKGTSDEEMRLALEKIKEACMREAPAGVTLEIQSAISSTDERHQNILEAVETAVFSMRSRKMMDRSSSHTSLLDSLAQTLMEGDEDTEEHVSRTRFLGEQLGHRLRLNDLELANLSLLCLLHDIGKVGVPLEILNKPSKLTENEWQVMKSHVNKGYRIAKASEELTGIADYILYHHEAWDGSGYPDGLKEDSIPLLSRIIAIVDAYDAMTNDRPYHKAISDSSARAELKRCAGSQFDPYLVNEFLALLDEIKPLKVQEDLLVPAPGTTQEIIKQAESKASEKLHVNPIISSTYSLGEDFRIIVIDEMFTEITGYTMEDLETYHLTQWDLIPPDDREIYMQEVARQRKNSDRVQIEHRIKRKDGGYRYVLCFGFSHFDAVSRKVVDNIRVIDIEHTGSLRELRQAAKKSNQRNMNKWVEMLRKDSLTGVFNHKAFINNVEMQLLRPDRHLIMMILDVDNFKSYNDSYGHMEGDRLLALLARILEQAVEPREGFAGRLGGDEFAAAFLLEERDYLNTDVKAQVQYVFTTVQNVTTSQERPATISMGAVLADGERNTFNRLYQTADQALYESKEKGRNCYTLIQ